MVKKFLSILLVFVLVHTSAAAQATAKTQADKDARHTAKVREGILKLGTGPKARVRLELRDRTKLEGFVGEAGADTFTVTDAKTGQSTPVGYGQVAKIKGHNMSTGMKIAIGAGIAAGVILIALGALIAGSGGGNIGGF
ncbi:MAG TPA: hypothetical protein VGX48_03855 [Pyrinomonadaceae bacterium]|jgi:hypothetical protein|nr:hypothetical protein [Pyrinomonadaceae bacterium]